MATVPSSGSFAKRLVALDRGYGVLALAGIQAAVALFLLKKASTQTSALAGLGWTAACFLAYRIHAGICRRRERERSGRSADQELSEGLTLLLTGDLVGAETHFRDLAALYPRDVEASLYLGLTLRDQGNLPTARAILKKSLRMDLGRKWTPEILKLLVVPHQTG